MFYHRPFGDTRIQKLLGYTAVYSRLGHWLTKKSPEYITELNGGFLYIPIVLIFTVRKIKNNTNNRHGELLFPTLNNHKV